MAIWVHTIDAPSYRRWLKAATPDAKRLAQRVPDGSPRLVVSIGPGAAEDKERTWASLKAQMDTGWSATEDDASAGSVGAAQRAAAEAGALWLRLRAGETLAPHAISRWRLEANDGEADVVYADEDVRLSWNRRGRPWLKPSFDPDLLLTQNALGHAVAYRAAAIPEPGLAGHALALAICGKFLRSPSPPVRRIPEVLLTRRREDTAPWQTEVDQAAVRRILDRDGRGARLDVQEDSGRLRILWPVSSPEPLVSFIIPTRDRPELLEPCVEGLLNRTDYGTFEILIADNDTTNPQALALFERWSEDGRVRVLRCPGPFNFSGINNRAAAQARGSILVLLNNDTEVMNPAWLREMVSLAGREEIGAVGARLLYPSGRLQHGGVVVGLGGIAGHDLCLISGKASGPQDLLYHVRTVSAVTAACLAIRKDLFDHLGGFDEKRLPVAYNDVDFCLRVARAGYRNLITPFATLLHKESASRGDDMSPQNRARWERDCAMMKKIWGSELDVDPYYHPGLTLMGVRRSLSLYRPTVC